MVGKMTDVIQFSKLEYCIRSWIVLPYQKNIGKLNSTYTHDQLGELSMV